MTLSTPRLLLRELLPTDAAALNEFESNPDVTRYMSFDAQTMEQTRVYLAEAVQIREKSPRTIYDLAIVLRADAAASEVDGVLIGRCGLGLRRPEHREAELWYVLHPAQVGHGYATEAAAALLDFGFETLGLHRIYADCDPRNAASCRVTERLGMRLEGVMRENYWLRGEWCNASIYAVLEHEWKARRTSSQVELGD